ncbi:hypothetical protein T4B_13242 [Trichinella pseudospiralis]|uniref:Uncharacterized protein n=1 Tax=Trichinella pseudospiralis TaxID=6337 RepID=A0A0V1DMD5_TRIPS|nr:hypothetical protein T4A_2684 [Trichinella pseudospiralis]KRY81056.1 hypothetical protein T4B_13242 [Trichinella pseudospiralis]
MCFHGFSLLAGFYYSCLDCLQNVHSLCNKFSGLNNL